MTAVWLHATTPQHAAPVEALAAHLAAHPRAPRALVSGTPGLAGPGGDPRSIDILLDAQKIKLVVLVGSSLTIPIIERARARGIGLMLVDAEDPRPGGAWRLLPGHTRAVLLRFAQIHARSPHAAGVMRRLVRAAVPVFETGTLARFAPARACNASELEALREALGMRPVWFAQALPEAEFVTILQAQAQALRRAHRLMLIVQPADPAQGADLALRATKAGFGRALRSADDDIDETTQIYIADAEDDPGLFLRLAPVTYLGGSLTAGAPVPAVMGPAGLGSALIFGPEAPLEARAHLSALANAGAACPIDGAAQLGEAVGQLLTPEIGADMALRAWQQASEGAEATETVALAICDWLVLHGAAA